MIRYNGEVPAVTEIQDWCRPREAMLALSIIARLAATSAKGVLFKATKHNERIIRDVKPWLAFYADPARSRLGGIVVEHPAQ
jgi:hypothetical protein